MTPLPQYKEALRPLMNVEVLLELHGQEPKTEVGATAETRRALLHSATVMLVAQFEAFVEKVFEDAARELYGHLDEGRLNALFNATSRAFHNPGPSQIDRLFLNLGMPDVMSRVAVGKKRPHVVAKTLKDLLDARHHIAHGYARGHDKVPPVTKRSVVKWMDIVLGTCIGIFGAVQAEVKARAS